MGKTLVSIITVCFNSEKTIRTTIESVLNQTYGNIEYIIVDGKSKDNTINIIKEYDRQFKEKGYIYKYISEKDTGIYDAMNKGIKLTKGEIIGIINSDDWYENDAVENVIESYIENKNSSGIYMGKMYRRYNNGKITIRNVDFRKNVSTDYIFRKISRNHPSTFVTRDIYMNFGGFDLTYRICSDYEFYIRSYFNDEIKFIEINSVLAILNDGGISTQLSTRKQRLKEHFSIRKKYSNRIISMYYLIYSFRNIFLYPYVIKISKFIKLKREGKLDGEN